MGLRLLAHFFDQSEALIVRSVLDAAGVIAFVENYQQNAVQPFSQIGLGGYRVMVPEEELGSALAVIDEGRRNRSFEGERLVKQHIVVPHILLTLLGQFWIWYLPLRRYSWRQV